MTSLHILVYNLLAMCVLGTNYLIVDFLSCKMGIHMLNSILQHFTQVPNVSF